MMENEKDKWVDEIINHRPSERKQLSQEQKNHIVNSIGFKAGNSFIKFAVITLLLLFTFNILSARAYYKANAINIEQSIYKLYFESINQ